MNISLLFAILTILLLGSSWIAFAGNKLVGRSHEIGIVSIALSFVGALIILCSVASTGNVHFCMQASALLSNFLRVDFYIDRLSAVMMVLITAVSAVIQMYSARYMRDDPGYVRFFSLLGFMTFALLGMVTCGSLLMLLFWWQLVSFLLYLLLSHNRDDVDSVRAAFRTFVILRVGDIALLCGVWLAYKSYGTLVFPAVFERAAASAATLHLWAAGPEIHVNTCVTLLLFVGAMAKSAQLPLHAWLPETMGAPTPVSALMHAGVVNAGGFLINRLAPLYGLSPVTLHIIFIVGLFTAIFGTTVMLTRADIKTKLGFSTMGQMGFMIMECGLGAFALAIFHLIAHGIFKATLFLSAGSVIHKNRREPHLPSSGHSEQQAFRRLPWATGVLMTLLLPLVILLVANEVVEVELKEAQGTIILLFFAWVTSSQAILSLYSLRSMESWKVAGAMVLTACFIVFMYVWTTESFTCFLYPVAGEAAHYFSSAAFPLWFFDILVGIILFLLLSGWSMSYLDRHSEQSLSPRWMLSLAPVLYLWFWNRLYVDQVSASAARTFVFVSRKLDAILPDWLP
ncbi:MAG: NADH-quinone oxidoreductase subunit L [Candidatus Melainabacteria bacterium]|nr:NADH-quinone oxidoreductase subunit L [Candidatus Melainabacteria bacterium]